MKILVDIGHPAHVHLFRHFAQEMISKGHQVLFTCRDKEFETDLLQHYGLQYISFGRKYHSGPGKLWGMLKFDVRELRTAIKFKPDVFLSHGSMYAAHASAVLRKPHISLEDTFNFEQIRFYKPFTDVILTADYDHPLNSPKVIRYAGYHELAYLHPKRFQPDVAIRNELGVGENEKYVILRFVSWNATHDRGHKGITFVNKMKAIDKFSRYARVFISSEAELPNELKMYKLPVSPHRIHDALAFAEFLWAESFTMPAECSVLGTPSVMMHNTTSLYLKEQQEKYGLCYCFTESAENQSAAIDKGVEFLQTQNLKETWIRKRDALLHDKIDVTGFLVWFIENYPQSKFRMQEDLDYHLNFR